MGGAIRHHVEVSLFLNWVGGIQERLYRLEGDRLTLLTRPVQICDHFRTSHWAVRNGRHRVLLLLLEAGLDPNVPDNDGNTPLHLAVRSGSVAMLETLLGTAADVDARNFQAQTPLEYAVALPEAQVRERLTRRLLDAGASPARMSQFTEGRVKPRALALGIEAASLRLPY